MAPQQASARTGTNGWEAHGLKPPDTGPDFERFRRTITSREPGTGPEVGARTRAILDACEPRGGYVLGMGNSVGSYIPLGTCLAMPDEGRQCNRAHFGRAA